MAVLKAMLTSSKTRHVISLLSRAAKMSVITLRGAVSVEYLHLLADCSDSDFSSYISI